MRVVSHFSIPFPARMPSSRQVLASRQAVASKPVVHAVATQPVKTIEKTSGIWETGSFSFRDILDAINPFQHIPIISTIYRKLTGDQMGYASRVIGDTLFGGVFGSFISGAVSAIANVFVDAFTGKDIGEHMVAAIEPVTTPSLGSTAYAQTKPLRPVSQIVSHSRPHSRPETILADQIMNPNQAGMLPLKGISKAQAAIDQYKWQILAGDVKYHSNYWG